MTKVMVAFRIFSTAPKNSEKSYGSVVTTGPIWTTGTLHHDGRFLSRYHPRV
jgi:hypothetical protein